MSTLGLRAIENVIGNLVCSDTKVRNTYSRVVFHMADSLLPAEFYEGDLVLSIGGLGVIVIAPSCSFAREKPLKNPPYESLGRRMRDYHLRHQ